MALKVSNFAGAGGGGSDGGNITANNIFSNATLRVLDLISEGQIGGLVNGQKSIFFDDVPLQNDNGTYNFEDIEAAWVNGTADQPVLTNFGEVSQPQSVGVEVRHDYPVTEAIQNIDADKIRVIVSLSSLYSQDDEGNINETSVSFRFELSVNTTGNWTHLGDYTIEGKQNS